MLETVLIDDEKIVLNGMAKILEREPDVHLAGIADNGLDGIALIRKLKPEIVLTDIRMPGMTGLELIRAAKEELPDTVFIIFSGFNEFKYVKEAIGLGVIDYLEKPITVAKLRKVIDKARKICSYKKNYIEMTESIVKVERVCVEKALRDLYEQPQNEEKLLQTVLQHNESLEYAKAVCVMKVANRNYHTVDDYRSIVQGLTFELIDRQKVEVYSFYEKDNLVLTYFIMDQAAGSFVEKAAVIKENLGTEGIEFFAGVSRMHEDFFELHSAFGEADSALKYARYLEESRIVNINDVEYVNNIPRNTNENQNSIEFNFRIGQYGQCHRQISEYLNELRKLDVLPELFMQKCLETVFLLKRLLDEMGQETEETLDISYSVLREDSSADQFIGWTLENVGKLLAKAETYSNAGGNKTIRNVKQYIEANFQESISLDSLAEQEHMSATYLSMLFKKEEGITYIRYLTKVRMEKTMQFLRTGYKAKDVCELVGYHDYKYFSSQFKAYTGMTLDAYKKSFGQN